ncbi:hypothetical protein [Pandoraea sp. ISTKB]|uniref:hypothetical protein n=1 Tax=Pandoraea sp. ISTKB TaxID=1586708 RepID=UPI001112DCF3|nr:hypothetical protein [Pandoraea sp. ISTKB]
MLSTVFLITGFTSTHWLADLRFSESIIPSKDELIKIGPLPMSTIHTRNSTIINFFDKTPPTLYQEDIDDFSIHREDVLRILNENKNKPIAYLFVSNKNPIRQIWEIKIDNDDALTYETSLLNYKREVSYGYARFYLSIIFFAWFLISIIEINKIEKL